jgi:hypothetical protein
MAYVDPLTVQSPKGRVSDVEVVYDKGPAHYSWSIATLKWDGKQAVGIRWNGEVGQPGSGTPQSRGNATWFIVPDEIVDAVVSAAAALERDKSNDLLAGYQQMAADEERETEALSWSDALIGDGLEAR